MNQTNHVSYLIIGAGPAGLQSADLLRQRGDDYLVLERGSRPGVFFEQFPRHRTLLSINKVHTGYPDLDSRLRYDWNSLLTDDEELLFTRFSEDYFPSADEYVEYLRAFAERRELAIRYDTEVSSIGREDGRFVVTATGGERFTSDRLIVATGVSKPFEPDVQGIELCENYVDFDMDLEGFRDKRVMILGKGNSAFETADALTAVTRKIQVAGPKHVRLAWVSHFVGDVRAINNNFLDTYHLKGQNNVLDGELVEVTRREDGALDARMWFESRKREFTFVCDRILICTGFRFDTSLFDDTCQLEMACNGRLPAMTCEWESTSVPHLYFAGTLMQMRDRKKTMSSFIHGFRHNQLALDQILERKYRGGDWRHVREAETTPESLAALVIQRVSTSPGMFLQPGFLGDLLVVPEDGPARLYEDMPVDYIHEIEGPKHGRYYVISLEYGHVDGYMDPFAMPRGVGVPEDFYLHPIVRRFDGGEMAEHFFLPDDLDNDWRLDPDNRAKVEAFFSGELGGGP
ncbi:MAG TPA: NAD(P)-binding domain-containing protein, partial [Thermoanaerobaculia bacterium]|nr:NAD(P)-binding domain-containing protein [Thermoanaerobaculia bacterium]